MFSLSLSRRYVQPRESTEPLHTNSVPYEPAGRRALSGREWNCDEDLFDPAALFSPGIMSSSSTAGVELMSDQAWLETSAMVLAQDKGARNSSPVSADRCSELQVMIC